MEFNIQDPNDAETTYLLEALIGACTDAKKGGGAFAFVSPSGVKLLLSDKTFSKFASKHEFDLIVGLDAVTTVKSLEVLNDSAAHLPGLKVRAFVHKRKGTIFHPKFCWFGEKGGGTLIAGSGNLTRGGLTQNWEAFTVTSLTTSQTKTVENKWKTWTAENAARLRDLNDPVVVAEATANIVIANAAKAVAKEQGKAQAAESEEDAAEIAIAEPQDEVLIAQIPRASDRWNQANFDKETFETFFGAEPDSQQRIFLYHTELDGSYSDVPESRPSVAVKSHNYRFELAAAAGLEYPAAARPIAVFVRVALRTYRYRLLMPGDPHYLNVAAFLEANCPVKGNRVRRYKTDVATIRAAWPDSPLWGN